MDASCFTNEFFESIYSIDDITLNHIIYESGLNKNILPKIDIGFTKLKNDPYNRTIQRQLKDDIKKFTGIKKVYISIKKDYENAAVIPFYSAYIPTPYSAVENIKGIIKGDLPVLTKKEKASEYINKIYIILGDELIDFCSNRELTAIVLHELGHVYGHTSNLPSMIQNLLTVIRSSTLFKSIVLLPFIMTVKLALLINIIALIVTRTLTFFEHAGEYQSDKFVASYGYGQDLITVLNKFKNAKYKYIKQQSIMSKIFTILKDILFPATHPKDESRICKLMDTIKKEYKSMYPKLKPELSILFNELKCDNSIEHIKRAIA